jgi:RNA polymerase sigma factor (sigma-70 family)
VLVIAARSDPVKRAELVEIFRPRIVHMARHYRHSRVEQEELLQAGVVGLLQALERFDSKFTNCFWTYAAWWVRQAMQEAVSTLAGPVVLSDRALRQLARVRSAWEQHARRHACEPSTAELASASGLNEDKLRSLFAAIQPARGIDSEPSNAPPALAIANTIADARAEDAYEQVLLAVASESLPSLLAGLTERERVVSRGRFGLDGRTRRLCELARELGVTNERIRQIEVQALCRMRASAESSNAPAGAITGS